jgi:hypothetical protein
MEKENQVVGFDAVKATAQTVLAAVKEMTVTDEATAQAATLKRTEISGVLKMIETRRAELVKPIDDSKKVIQAEAKGISDPLEKAKADLFAKVSKWQTEQRMIAEAAAKKEREEAEARLAATMADDEATIEDVERVEAHVELAAKPVKMAKSLAPMKTRETWKFEIIDEKLIPREYLMVDTVNLGQAVRRAENPLRELAGVNIFSEVGAG